MTPLRADLGAPTDRWIRSPKVEGAPSARLSSDTAPPGRPPRTGPWSWCRVWIAHRAMVGTRIRIALVDGVWIAVPVSLIVSSSPATSSRLLASGCVLWPLRWRTPYICS